MSGRMACAVAGCVCLATHPEQSHYCVIHAQYDSEDWAMTLLAHYWRKLAESPMAQVQR